MQSVACADILLFLGDDKYYHSKVSEHLFSYINFCYIFPLSTKYGLSKEMPSLLKYSHN
jgi:hypothetical protein